jgi:hypothetical protein
VQSVVYDQNLKVPHGTVCYSGCETVYYDNKQSIADKCNWVLANNIGGAFTWDTSLDDFNGQFCGEGKFPLITSAIDTLNVNVIPNPIITSTSKPTIPFIITTPKLIPECIGKQGIIPYPNDCSLYINCYIQSIEACPFGKLFNAVGSFCDLEIFVQCGSKTTNSQKTTTTITTTTTTKTSTTTKPTTTLPTTSKAPIAECVGKAPTLYSHPIDCAKFINCIVQAIQTCPAGTLYNAAGKYCDFSGNVICLSSTTTKSTSTTATTTTTTRTTTSKSSANVTSVKALCDKDPTMKIGFVYDCTKFYSCDSNKNPVLNTCLTGMTFDGLNKKCNMPLVSKCVPKACVANERIPDQISCGKYYICSNSTMIQKSCVHLTAMTHSFDLASNDCQISSSSKTIYGCNP